MQMFIYETVVKIKHRKHCVEVSTSAEPTEWKLEIIPVATMKKKNLFQCSTIY